MWAPVRFQGRIVKARKFFAEPEEQAKDRAWYMAKNLPTDMSDMEKESRSRAWANEKYLGMTYEATPTCEQAS